jgi:uncharacterized protein YjcR
MSHPPEKKQLARTLFLKGWTIAEIANEINIKARTIYQWRDGDSWDEFIPPDSAEIALARRINILAERENKTKLEIEELDKLCKVTGDFTIKLATAKKIAAETRYIEANGLIPPSDGSQLKKNSRGKNKAVRNDVSGITAEALTKIREKIFYSYQKLWHAAKENELTRRNRFILKSRQIGATYYFAFEAFEDAVITGDNQIFLSASRDQAEVFKAYIIAFAKQYFDVELKGIGIILLSNGAELRFLSTNSTTAQSYHGHLYTDEVFWIPNFERVHKVSSGIAAQKKWRKTLFSTPSAQSHAAYKIWSGDKYNTTIAEKKRVKFDVSHAALKDGVRYADGIWRHCVTVVDAEKQGCDLFDIAALKLEYSKDEFDNLFMCKFIDDSKSVFNLQMLFDCAVDMDDWIDYKPNSARPFGNKPISVGFDPSRSINGDHTSCAVLEIPTVPQNPFRLLKRHTYHGKNLDYQANRIKDICDSHNVLHVGIDTTGMGIGVFELVEAFYPLATPIHYSMDMKNRLVLKGLDIMENKRFQFLLGDNELIRAFLMIAQKVTDNGSVTYVSNRTSDAGHADIAWSILHGLAYEPIRPRATATATFAS